MDCLVYKEECIMGKIRDIFFMWTYWILKGNKKEKVIGISILIAVIALTVVGMVMQYA